jgi:hypothetical protein
LPGNNSICAMVCITLIKAAIKGLINSAFIG